MSFQFPADVIHQVQITLRNAAGLSFYRGLDPALLSETTSTPGYDLSPEALRCKHCKGRLLNGLQSLICGFCGKYVNIDVPHEPVSFESTSSSRFLLRSLGLKGSEMIEVALEGRQFNRKSPTLRRRIPLSNLLDLQIEWPNRSSKPQTTTHNNTQQRTTCSTIHTELDLDELFPRLRKDKTHISNDEGLVKGNCIPVSTDEDNLTLFHDFQPSIVRSSNGGSFQFSDSVNDGGEETQLNSKSKGNFDEWGAFTSSITAQDQKESSNDRKESSNN